MRVLVLTNMYPTAGALSYGIFVQEQVESLRREGVEVDVLFVNGWDNKLNYLWGIARLWARLLTRRYDLIHAHYVFSGIIARMQFLYPVVLTHHGPEFWNWQFLPCRIITPLVDKVIVVSREMYDRLGFEKAEIIPCGVDFDLFRPIPQGQARRELGLPQDKKIILWAGQHTRPEKRFDLVKAATALVQSEDHDVEFMLVSGVPHARVHLYMNAADVLLLTSDAEGSPMVIKEAMACNLPIVSVPVGDVPEVIGDTEGCYLCTQEPADIAQKLNWALNPTRRTNGRDEIRHVELGKISREIISQYRAVLSARKRFVRCVLLSRRSAQRQETRE